MTSDAPYPMTSELLLAHPIYQRARTVLTTWHTKRLQEGPAPLKEWRQAQVDMLDAIAGKGPPEGSEWEWSADRELTVSWLRYDFLRCTYQEPPEVRLEAWRSLQRAVEYWDEKFADDTDVA